MVRVVLGNELRALAGGADELLLAATDTQALLAELRRRYPALADHVEHQSAIAIDGLIHQHPFAEPLAEHSEIHIIPRITAG
ncbi:MAG: hypothetical protein AMXMBFR6_03770 [Betaproteobacteria bacterium]|nr:MoaD/ThiS family protein [Rhodocyclaceae bacterium]MCG3185756.1 hypothetical protein [Rhodocyclaceae bacterium]